MTTSAENPSVQRYTSQDNSTLIVAETVHNHHTQPLAGSLDPLSVGSALEELAELPHRERARRLSATGPDHAAKILALMDLADAVPVVASMAQAVVDGILPGLAEDRAEILVEAVEAGAAIASLAASHREALGSPDPAKSLERVGPTADGQFGFQRDYAQGVVFWSGGIGAGLITGGIWTGFLDYGGVTAVGFPVGVAEEAPRSPQGTVGVVQFFADSEETDGPVYHSVHGTFTTWGHCRPAHDESGGTGGRLGFPVSEESHLELGPRASEGWAQDFEGATVFAFFRGEESESYAVGALFVDPYDDWCDDIGFPVSDEEDAEPSPYGTTGARQCFEGVEDYPEEILDGRAPFGAVAYASRRGAFVTTGEIGRFYERQGGPSGSLGYPTGPETENGDGSGQHFEGGYISWTPDRGAFLVPGIVRGLLQDQALGEPTSSLRTIDGGPDYIQFFERGMVTMIGGVAQRWLRPS